MNEEMFVNQICENFPYLKEDILDNDYEGLFSLQIGVLRQSTQAAIDTGDFDMANAHINFILNNFKNFNKKVENSIVLSYIQKLDFKNYPKSELFKNIQEALNNYNQSAYNDKKLINFLNKNNN